MKIAVFFPGQGSQCEGMGKEFYDSDATFKKAFDLCSKNTDIDLKKACFDGDGLELTSVTQPALYAVNIATYKMLESMGFKGDIFAGLSLGEYDALAAADVLNFAETTSLVAKRGKLMEGAVPQGIASMTAVIGLVFEDVQKIIDDIDDVWVANINSSAQIIIGGKIEALDIADEKLKNAGAIKVSRLNVAGPFHTPLLEDAGKKLLAELLKCEISEAKKTVYSNVTGNPYEKNDDVREILSKQVSSKVHWANIMQSALEQADVVIECGPGNVLSKLAKRQLKGSERAKDVQIFKAATPKDIQKLKEALGK